MSMQLLNRQGSQAERAYDHVSRNVKGENYNGILVAEYVTGHLTPLIEANLLLDSVEVHKVVDSVTAAALLWPVAENAVLDSADQGSSGVIGRFLTDIGVGPTELELYQRRPYETDELEKGAHRQRRHTVGLLADAHHQRTALEYLADRCIEADRRFVHPSDFLRLAQAGVNIESLAIGASRIASTLRNDATNLDKRVPALLAESAYGPFAQAIGLDGLAADLDNMVIRENGVDSSSVADAEQRLAMLSSNDASSIVELLSPVLSRDEIELESVNRSSVGYDGMMQTELRAEDSTLKTREKSLYSLAGKIEEDPRQSRDIMDIIGITLISPDAETNLEAFIELVRHTDNIDDITLQSSASKVHPVTIQGPAEWIKAHAQVLNALSIPFNAVEAPFKILKFTASAHLNGRDVKFELQTADKASYEDSRVGDSAHLLMKAEKKGVVLTEEEKKAAANDLRLLALRAAHLGNPELNEDALPNIDELSKSTDWLQERVSVALL